MERRFLKMIMGNSRNFRFREVTCRTCGTPLDYDDCGDCDTCANAKERIVKDLERVGKTAQEMFKPKGGK